MDIAEERKVEEFIEKGCGCHDQCSSKFDANHYSTMRNDCMELAKTELDFFIMGSVSTCVFDSDDVGSSSRHKVTPRKRPRSCFHHRGIKVMICIKLSFHVFKNSLLYRFVNLHSCFYTELVATDWMPSELT